MIMSRNPTQITDYLLPKATYVLSKESQAGISDPPKAFPYQNFYFGHCPLHFKCTLLNSQG